MPENRPEFARRAQECFKSFLYNNFWDELFVCRDSIYKISEISNVPVTKAMETCQSSKLLPRKVILREGLGLHQIKLRFIFFTESYSVLFLSTSESLAPMRLLLCLLSRSFSIAQHHLLTSRALKRKGSFP